MASILFDVLQDGDGAHECGGAAGAAAQLGQLPLALEGGYGPLAEGAGAGHGQVMNGAG